MIFVMRFHNKLSFNCSQQTNASGKKFSTKGVGTSKVNFNCEYLVDTFVRQGNKLHCDFVTGIFSNSSITGVLHNLHKSVCQGSL